jgi:hypothetical protein
MHDTFLFRSSLLFEAQLRIESAYVAVDATFVFLKCVARKCWRLDPLIDSKNKAGSSMVEPAYFY